MAWKQITNGAQHGAQLLFRSGWLGNGTRSLVTVLEDATHLASDLSFWWEVEEVVAGRQEEVRALTPQGSFPTLFSLYLLVLYFQRTACMARSARVYNGMS